jgi:hypothetical protein
MSAYIVEKAHIVYLVHAAMSRRLNSHGSSFVWNAAGAGQPWHRGDLTCNDYEKAAEVANMLYAENLRSIQARYPGGGDSIETIRPSDFATVPASIDPVQVLKSCDCLEYQSCEHDGWGISEAKAFLCSLRKHAWQSLAGYDAAAWGPPRPAGANRVQRYKLN